MPDRDVAYFMLRLMLSALLAAAAFSTLQMTWTGRLAHRPWRLSCVGGILVAAACILSTYDAIENILLRPNGCSWGVGCGCSSLI
jgi:hypothetical protein